MLTVCSPVTIARVCKMASDLHNDSFDPARWRHNKHYEQCVAEAVNAHDLDPKWSGLIYAMISSEFCEPSDWWNQTIAEHDNKLGVTHG
jgi:hypothetical protein